MTDLPLHKPESWKKRYFAAFGLLIFFAFEYDRIVAHCMSAEGCQQSTTTEALISATEQGIFWCFVTVIMGRAAQPIINRVAMYKWGRGLAPDPEPKAEGAPQP